MTIPLTPAQPAGTTLRPVDYAPSVGKRLQQEQFGGVVAGIKDINNLTDEEFSACVEPISPRRFLGGVSNTPPSVCSRPHAD